MRVIAAPGETLKSGTAAIINGSEGVHPFVITMSDYGAMTSFPESLLKGNYVEGSLTQSDDIRKFVLAENAFRTFDGSKEIAANQCWLECKGTQASELAIFFNDHTGIDDIHHSTQNKDSKIYDISGKRLKSTQKGINIVDNKKILVK